MPAPRRIRYYLLNAVSSPGGSHWDTSEIPPAQAFLANASGWVVGNQAAGAFWDSDFGTELAANTSSGSAFRYITSGSAAGNCILFGPYRGLFASGSWQITMSLKSNTNGTPGSGSFYFQFWKSANASGGGATLITPTFFSSSAGRPTTVASVPLFATCSLPSFYCYGEYVLLQVGWRNNVAGANGSADLNWNIGPTTQSSYLTPTYYGDDGSSFIQENFDEWIF